MKRKLFIISLLLIASRAMMATVPEGYYLNIDGKKYTDLKEALTSIISSHKVLGYNNLWEYYPSTYYHLDNKKQVLDMYSDIEYYYGNSGSAVSGMNREHTVPKSWWGGSTGAAPGNDLFNVIPSDQKANSSKSNYPLGIVTGSVSFDNGCTKIGKGSVNGGTSNVFEPKDDYKGDFARIYFYMATCYPDQAWDSNNATAMTNSSKLTLKSYIVPMLIEWSNNDPVDLAEITRNEDIYKVQGNRNPFIDYPELVSYIWGSQSDEYFYLDEHTAYSDSTDTVIKAVAAKFSVPGGTEDNPYEIADNSVLTITGGASSAVLYVRVNDGEWDVYNPTKRYNGSSDYYIAATTDVTITGDMHVEAYCSMTDRANSDTISYWYKGTAFSNEYLLYEPFDEVKAGNNTSNTGSSSAWNGNDNFPTVTKAYAAGNAIKLGSGSAEGVIESKALDFDGGTLDVSIDVKGWTKIEGTILVSLTGAETQEGVYTATMSDDFETLQFTFTGVSANPVLTIETSAKRAFIDNIKVSANVPTAIAQPEKVANPFANGIAIYNLNGQRVNKIGKGIVIINGKKFVK